MHELQPKNSLDWTLVSVAIGSDQCKFVTVIYPSV